MLLTLLIEYVAPLLLQNLKWASSGPCPRIPADKIIELINDYNTEGFKQAVDNADTVFSMKRDDEQATYEIECAQLSQASRTLPRAPPTEGQTQYVAFATTANGIRPSGATVQQRTRDLTSQVQVTREV